MQFHRECFGNIWRKIADYSCQKLNILIIVSCEKNISGWGGDISPKKLNGLSILKDTQYVIIIGCVS